MILRLFIVLSSGGSRIFPRGGAPTPKSAIIFQFFAENCMKMKEFEPPGGGARPWRPPLDLPMLRIIFIVLEKIFYFSLCQNLKTTQQVTW